MQKQRELACHRAQVEYQKRGLRLQEIQQVLRVAAQTRRQPSAKAEGIPGLSDCSDVFARLEEDFAKGKIVLKSLSKELLEDSVEYAGRQLEAFTNDASENMRKKVEVRKPIQNKG